MKKRFLAFFMILTLIVSLFAGCGNDNNGNAVDEPVEVITEIETTSTNAFGWDVPAETINFSFYKKGQINPDKSETNLEIMNAYLLEEFNININKIVYDTDREERFNLMLTSGDYPEVMTGLNKADLVRLQDLGIAVNVAPYVDELGSNIKKELGENYGRYVEESGEVYGLPYAWGMLPIPDYSAHLRLDWYTEMGSPKFETPEEYYEVLKEMVALHPENENGESVYALSWNAPGADMINGINTVAGAYGLKKGYKEAADHTLTHWINTPEGKELTAFYNQAHRDGLFDPDAFSNKYDDWKAKFSTERILGHVGPWWQSWNAGHEVWQKLDENWTEEQRYVQVKIKADSAETAYLSPKDTTGWGYTVITDKCENPSEVMRVLDFMITPNGTRLMAWGVPNLDNSNWIIEDEEWMFNEKAKSEIVNATYDYPAHDLIGSSSQIWLIHPEGAMSDAPKANAWIDQCFNDEAKWKKVMNDNLKDTIYDNSAMNQIVFLPENPVSIIKQQVEDAIQSSWTKTVLSNTPEEFEKNYSDMVSFLEKAGVNELEEYMSTEYKAILANWGNN